MWYILFLAFFILAILFLFLAIKMENTEYWNIMFTLLSMSLWLILSLSVMKIEFPYQFYNATTDAVELGYNYYTSPISYYESYIFGLMFIITLIYFLAMIWDKWYNYKNWHGGN